MTTKSIFTFFLVLNISFGAFGQRIEWATGPKSTGPDEGRGVVVSRSGSVFLAGHFRNQLQFAAPNNLTSRGLYDGFLAKYSSNGALGWLVQAGSIGDDQIYGIVLSPDQRHVFVCGTFKDSMRLGQANNVIKLVSRGGEDAFLAKYDTLGNAIWARRFGGSSDENGYALAIDAAGDVGVTGEFRTDLAFDSTTQVGLSQGSADIFIAKFSGQTGRLQWFRACGGTGLDAGRAICADRTGNFYITGSYRNTVLFASATAASVGSITALDGADMFLAKYSGAGRLVRVFSISGPDTEIGRGLDCDTSENVYLIGRFRDSVTVRGAGDSLKIRGVGVVDILMLSYDSSGQIRWGFGQGGAGNDIGINLSTDRNGGLYATSYFQETARFGRGSRTVNLVSAGSSDVSVIKYDFDGNMIWGHKTGGPGDEIGYGIAPNADGDAYTTGYFVGNSSFLGINMNTQPAGVRDVFLCKTVMPTLSLNPNNLVFGSGSAPQTQSYRLLGRKLGASLVLVPPAGCVLSLDSLGGYTSGGSLAIPIVNQNANQRVFVRALGSFNDSVVHNTPGLRGVVRINSLVTSTNKSFSSTTIQVFPTVFGENRQCKIELPTHLGFVQYLLVDVLGKVHLSGNANSDFILELPQKLPLGMYYLQLYNLSINQNNILIVK